MADLKISNLYKTYGKVEVLKDVNLDIASGEFVVFVGPSGCGKTTLLRTIAGLEDITAGDMWLKDRRINDVDPARRGVAMVFQSYALYPHMTVARNMAFSLRLARAGKAEIAKRVARAAEILHLEGLLDRRPGQLSGGQKQRVAIGRAIVRDPDLFLFDEPLSNLDAELRITMRAELAQLHRELGATMIYVTHDQVEAMTLADRIVVMNGGRVQQVGAPLQVFDDPNNTFVAGFIGTPRMNFIGARVTGATADTVTVALRDLAGVAELVLPFRGFNAAAHREITLGIRPEAVSLLPADAPEGAPFHLVHVEDLGASTSLIGRLQDNTPMTVQVYNDRYSGGEDFRIGFDPARVMLFGADGERLRPTA